MLYHLQDEIDTSNSPLMQIHGGADLVLVNTDRGLCGGLNANLIKMTGSTLRKIPTTSPSDAS
ncbi:MAG: hypothetical protein ACLT8E_10670 [Akkermansia sp.]